MSWDSVPWTIGGGQAQHTPEMCRLLAYVSFGGQEGILASTDLRVFELSTPGAGVRMLPGSCAILSRASGGSQQAYAGRLPSEVNVGISGTGSQPRSDLVVVRVEDPYPAGEPWSIPADESIGPYIFTRVIENVPASTTTVTELGLGYTAIPCARIDVPANESDPDVVNGWITDLRQMVNSLSNYQQNSIQHPSGQQEEISTDVWTDFPSTGNFTVTCPEWATRADIVCQVQTLRFLPDGGSTPHNIFGNVRVTANGATSGQDSRWNMDWPQDSTRGTIGHGQTHDMVPHQGQPVTFQVQNKVRSTAGTKARADDGTSTLFQITFRQSPVWNP